MARIPVEVNVIPNPEQTKRGNGFPKLLLTDRDLDPATGTIRPGDPDQPPLWQEASDFVHNVWWLNLQSPEAAFAFRQRPTNATLWRTYHAEAACGTETMGEALAAALTFRLRVPPTPTQATVN